MSFDCRMHDVIHRQTMSLHCRIHVVIHRQTMSLHCRIVEVACKEFPDDTVEGLLSSPPSMSYAYMMTWCFWLLLFTNMMTWCFWLLSFAYTTTWRDAHTDSELTLSHRRSSKPGNAWRCSHRASFLHLGDCWHTWWGGLVDAPEASDSQSTVINQIPPLTADQPTVQHSKNQLQLSSLSSNLLPGHPQKKANTSRTADTEINRN